MKHYEDFMKILTFINRNFTPHKNSTIIYGTVERYFSIVTLLLSLYDYYFNLPSTVIRSRLTHGYYDLNIKKWLRHAPFGKIIFQDKIKSMEY